MMKQDKKKILIGVLIAFIWVTFLMIIIYAIIRFSDTVKVFIDSKKAIEKLLGAGSQSSKNALKPLRAEHNKVVFNFVGNLFFNLCVPTVFTVVLVKIFELDKIKKTTESLDYNIRMADKKIPKESRQTKAIPAASVNLLSSTIIHDGENCCLSFARTNIELAGPQADVSTMRAGEHLRIALEGNEVIVLNSKQSILGKFANGELKERIEKHLENNLPIVARFESPETKTISVGLYD